ncbi:(2Fe-2S) ferredoxin domain-containing protein [Geitlerinema sp. PCC 9228]|jgi:(2Fe-2S) ferredoxin|uniref:(2Fe-2S) ferredoxin domain-containing protein n=1 Tax=Geitlerinema sp. PCC 9228 TaxID=111611 RepID=UPI0008F98AED|nr:(2Fe-2S) ferredoxin domain-containing protein [Geitlerinema sp. PCC 9228]
MKTPKHHIFVCGGFRLKGDAQGVCGKKGSVSLLQYLETELCDRDLEDVVVSSTGCLKQCDKGPILMVYPEGYWYGSVDEDTVDEILDALESGEAASEYLLTSNP